MEIKEFIGGALEQSKGGLDRTLDGLTVEEMNWHPKPDANSIALILFHIVKSEDSFVSILSGKPLLWEADKWYAKLNLNKDEQRAHYTADQVARFNISNIKELNAFFNAVRSKTIDYVKSLSPERFNDKVNLPPPPPAPKGAPPHPKMPDFTVGLLLGMTLTHAASHGGEISYIRGLKRGLDK